MHVEPCPLGVFLKFTCSDLGPQKGLKLATNKLVSIKKKNQLKISGKGGFWFPCVGSTSF